MKIVVLAGGTSTEREVSLISGTGIYRALKERGHQVVLLDVYLGYKGDADDIFADPRDWSEGISAIKEESPDLAAVKALRPDGDRHFFGPNVMKICEQADVVFMALHGANGEDGKIQAVFELNGIPYTGTDYLSSAICMDKGLTKELFMAGGIPTPKGYTIRIGEEVRDVKYPAVVKVTNGGSSVGVYFVNNDTELQDALEKAKAYDDEVVIEQYIKGREFTCGLIGGKALPLVEIEPLQGSYDYKNKYQPGMTKETCPANLSEEKTKEIQCIAEKAWKVLRLRSYARMDFMMDEDGTIYCLEANTLPGMTPISLLPQEAAATGMSYPELCEKLIEVSLGK
ncbi:MAG: D-alanine--D-alanine ligase [Lachnospiraceae bacterium]|nr:D-alanine--D-alanine ligase [Lachnospiraceae bacterium]